MLDCNTAQHNTTQQQTLRQKANNQMAKRKKQIEIERGKSRPHNLHCDMCIMYICMSVTQTIASMLCACVVCVNLCVKKYVVSQCKCSIAHNKFECAHSQYFSTNREREKTSVNEPCWGFLVLPPIYLSIGFIFIWKTQYVTFNQSIHCSVTVVMIIPKVYHQMCSFFLDWYKAMPNVVQQREQLHILCKTSTFSLATETERW